MRRKRQSDWSRRLVRENRLSADDLVLTTIITDSDTPEEPVPSLPGVSRLNLDALVKQAQEAADLGIPAIALFPHIDPSIKDNTGSEALNADGLVPQAIRRLKSEVSDIGVIVDVALDPFTDHGHDGVLKGDIIDNDETLEQLGKASLILAEAGADIAPSDMMDGRVGVIRSALDDADFQDVMILSYAAKYASAFYGPYRDAIGTSAALRGDKRTYQMDPGQYGRSPARSLARPGRRGRHGHGQTGSCLSRYLPSYQNRIWYANTRLSGQRRIRHDRGSRREWLD